MALRARLVPTAAPARQAWPWHAVKCRCMPISAMLGGDRRLDAETYLSSGHGIRASIEAQNGGWVRFGTVAHAWAPPRIKMVLVSPEHGTPYLNTSQIFDYRAIPRKWLAMEKITKAESRLAKQGTILLMASASVGRSTLVTGIQEGCVLSHHFMRVEPVDPDQAGWIYAYLRSPQARAMMNGAQYASVIRHIEPHHVAALPVPTVPENTAGDFKRRVHRILDLRNESHRLTVEAEERFAQAIGPIEFNQKEEGFVARASDMFSGHRRLEASYHTPQAASILARFKRADRLRDVAERVWWMPRFKRFYGDGGIPYLSADELFTINPQETKRILVDPGDNHHDYFVEPGWIVMACSGQVYGLNGAAAIITDYHANTFFSHDLIRIIADKSKIRAGYLLVSLTHRTHGRPILIRAAYGTSIPHLDPGDVADFPVVRLGDAVESGIADLAEASAKARAEADALERQIAADAEAIISRFIAHATGSTSRRPYTQ